MFECFEIYLLKDSMSATGDERRMGERASLLIRC